MAEAAAGADGECADGPGAGAGAGTAVDAGGPKQGQAGVDQQEVLRAAGAQEEEVEEGEEGDEVCAGSKGGDFEDDEVEADGVVGGRGERWGDVQKRWRGYCTILHV